MDSMSGAIRIEQGRRRMRRLLLAMMPVEIVTLGAAYFLVPMPEALALAALYVVGGFAAVAAYRRMGSMAARAARVTNPPEVGRPVGTP